MVTVGDVHGWAAGLDGVIDRIAPRFGRAEPRRRVGAYLRGLLAPVERKNGWQLAEHLGDARPWRTQRVLSHVLWDEEAARDLCREHAVERLCHRDTLGARAGASLGEQQPQLRGRHPCRGDALERVARRHRVTALQRLISRLRQSRVLALCCHLLSVEGEPSRLKEVIRNAVLG